MPFNMITSCKNGVYNIVAEANVGLSFPSIWSLSFDLNYITIFVLIYCIGDRVTTRLSSRLVMYSLFNHVYRLRYGRAYGVLIKILESEPEGITMNCKCCRLCEITI